jgi:predicted metal-dependent hydrolase
MIESQQSPGRYVLRYGNTEIPFGLQQSERSTLKIDVHPDLRVEVLAPANKSLEAILSRVERRAGWIAKQWRFFEQYQPKQPERRFVSGETHVYLGRQYRLKVVPAPVSAVKLSGRFFCVRNPDPADTTAIAGLLEDWYLRHALALFTTRAKTWIAESRALGLRDYPTLVVRAMSRRWGSCSPKGTITLNVALVKVPLAFIDYVIVHELCHLKIHNHSPAFYRLLTRVMPDWRSRKERLEGFGV